MMPISYAQASGPVQGISLNKKNVSIEEVFKALKQQTDYDFIYSKKQLSRTTKVTVKVENATITEVLDHCFERQPLTYQIENQSIIIKERQKANQPLSGKTKITELEGKVTDEQGRPLTGATINIKGSNLSMKTDANGTFVILTPANEGILIVTYTGYESKEIKFDNDQKKLLINLKIALNDLNEIQVIGYGETTRKLNTGSISTISAKEIEQQPVTNVLSALSGRMPGVFVQTTNGLPGGNINIQVRGKGSILAGTDPLYIVDGVPYEGNAVGRGNTDASNITGAISPLNNLNPSDIASISVLKDADATSIYGSRGTNGVILITTKKAQSGNTGVNVNLNQGYSAVAQAPNLLKLADYLQMRREAYANDKLTPSSDLLSPNYAPDLLIWNQSEETDWPDYVLGNTAHTTDLQARIMGGKANTTFSISGNYHDEGTMLIGHNNFKRGGLTSRLQHFSENQNFSADLSTQLSTQSSDFSNLITNIHRSFLTPPNYPLFTEAGGVNWAASNPLAETNARSKTNIDNAIINLQMSYKLLPELRLKLNSGYTKTSYDQVFKFPNSALSPGSINYSNFTKTGSNSFLIEPQLDYNLTIGSSKIALLAGSTFQNRSNYSQAVIGTNFNMEGLMENLGSAATITANSTNGQYKYVSVFARATYNLLDTYILNATVRRDGSSRFGPGHRFGNFGSLGASWIVSNLSVVKSHLPFITHGKFHASYGSTGNDQISDYGYLSTYSSPGSTVYQGVSVIRPSRISNDQYQWERTNKLDIGFELGLFNDRIYFSADYYNNQSTDQLVSYALPQSTGFSSYQANLPAVIQNTGWEFAVNAKFVNRDKFTWSGNFNITFLKNQLKSFENFENSSYSSSYELGYDITRIIGYKAVGIDVETGKVQYAGKDGLPSATPEFFNTLGKITPDYYGGIGNNFTLGRFELNIFAQFVKQVSRGGLSRNPGSGFSNTFNLTRWSASNPDSNIPAASTQFDSRLNQSSVNIFNTSFLRVKNVSFYYNFPKHWIQKIKLSSVRLYLEGQNLFTIWDKDAAVMDPESGAISVLYGRNLPPVKTVIIGLQLNF